MKDLSEHGDTDTVTASLYTAYADGPWYWNGVATYGHQAYDTHRTLDFGSIDRTAHAGLLGPQPERLHGGGLPGSTPAPST